MATAATKASSRYQKKKGLISKSYKLDQITVDRFAEACAYRETTQAKELTTFMKLFIKENHPDYD